MEIDKTTLNDLSIFNTEEEFSVFHKLNLCGTIQGREQLRANFSTPLHSIEEILGIQETLKLFILKPTQWPRQISNGTIMVVEKYYEATIDPIPSHPSAVSSFTYRLLHSYDFSLVKYSVQHCFDLIKGMQLIITNYLEDDTPAPLKKVLENAKRILDKEQFVIISNNERSSQLTDPQLLQLAHFIRYQYKHNMNELIGLYAQLDAWQAMAKAVIQYGLVFPGFLTGNKPSISATGLYHMLLPDPVSYDIILDEKGNFLFLTGANMAGKSTFIKSVGTAVFMAHTGMGVPARSLQLTLFDGMLSNINIADNLVKGESYFYNEVQRIKSTVLKINDSRKWLILMDELFKGTNVQDAMKCSSSVIEGLLKIHNSLFILSTHLYEIGQDLKKYPNIHFRYFETIISGDQLRFSYQLKEGISNDRLGYLILKKEGVVAMLENL